MNNITEKDITDRDVEKYLNLPTYDNILKEIKEDKKSDAKIRIVSEYIFIPENEEHTNIFKKWLNILNKSFWNNTKSFYENLKNKDKFDIVHNNVIKSENWENDAAIFILKDKKDITLKQKEKNEIYFEEFAEKYSILFDWCETIIK
jgi:hypothetical protein